MRHHRRLVAPAAARLAILWLTLGIAAACGDPAPDDYGDDVEREFLEACQTGASSAVCQCIYDRVEADVPFERFAELDADLDPEDESTYPDDISSIAVRCAARHGVGDGG